LWHNISNKLTNKERKSVSPLLIGALVAGGVVILISIGFISHAMERARIERARLSAELTARVNVCSGIANQLPGQFMSPDLKKLLLHIEIFLLEKLLRLDRKHVRAQDMLDSAERQLRAPEAQIANPPVKIDSQMRAKEVKEQLENLNNLLHQAHRDGLLDKAGLMEWSNQISQHLVTTAIQMFQVMAEEGMRQGKPRVAKLQYERAISYLNSLQNPAYASQIERFRQLLQMATDATVQMEQSATAQSSELSAGLQELEQTDESWKKKSVYDD